MKDVTMGNQQAKASIPWFIGFFDGEGSFILPQHKVKGHIYYSPRITIAGTCFETRDAIVSLYKEHAIGHHIEYRAGTEKCRDSWQVRTQGMKRCKKWFEVFPPV